MEDPKRVAQREKATAVGNKKLKSSAAAHSAASGLEGPITILHDMSYDDLQVKLALDIEDRAGSGEFMPESLDMTHATWRTSKPVKATEFPLRNQESFRAMLEQIGGQGQKKSIIIIKLVRPQLVKVKIFFVNDLGKSFVQMANAAAPQRGSFRYSNTELVEAQDTDGVQPLPRYGTLEKPGGVEVRPRFHR